MNSKPTLAEDFAAHFEQAEAQGEYGALGFFVSENAQAILEALRSHERMREALEEIAHGADLSREDCRFIALKCPGVSKRGRHCG